MSALPYSPLERRRLGLESRWQIGFGARKLSGPPMGYFSGRVKTWRQSRWTRTRQHCTAAVTFVRFIMKGNYMRGVISLALSLSGRRQDVFPVGEGHLVQSMSGFTRVRLSNISRLLRRSMASLACTCSSPGELGIPWRFTSGLRRHEGRYVRRQQEAGDRLEDRE